MKNLLFRILAVSLATVIVLPMLASCHEKGGTSSSSSEAPSKGVTPTESVPKPSYPSLEGKNPVSDNGAYAVYDLSYGSRVDLSSTESKASSQIFDLYLPSLPGSIPADAKVFVYVHGGAWSDVNYTKDNDCNWLCRELAASGMIVFSMNYVLAGSRDSGDSVDDMINDIEAMLSHAKKLLSELGVKATSCGIGGTSAGGHLSALYAYSCKKTAPIPIAFEADVVGPVDITVYKPIVDAYIKSTGSYSAFAGLESGGMSFSEIFGSMAGMKNVTEADLPKLWDKMKELSPVNYVDKDSCPTILLYGLVGNDPTNMIPADIKSDGLVPYSCYEELTDKLRKNGVAHTGKVFDGYGHGDLPWKSPANDWIKEQILQYSDTYIK